MDSNIMSENSEGCFNENGALVCKGIPTILSPWHSLAGFILRQYQSKASKERRETWTMRNPTTKQRESKHFHSLVKMEVKLAKEVFVWVCGYMGVGDVQNRDPWPTGAYLSRSAIDPNPRMF